MRLPRGVKKVTPMIAMGLAFKTAETSTAPNRKVGAVVWREKGIIGGACNAPPWGTPTCVEVGCWDINGQCMRNAHAEEAMVAICARQGHSLNDTFVCVTEQPCIHCARMMAIAGVKMVYYWNPSDYVYAYKYEHFDNVKLGAIRLVPESAASVVAIDPTWRMSDKLSRELLYGQFIDSLDSSR